MTMPAGPATWSEADRQAALDRYGVLDTPPEAAFDELVRLAADFLNAPIAAVHLIDRDRQWAKAEIGLGVSEMPRERSFCTHAVAQNASMVVPDATADLRFAMSPLVTGDPGIRFYAGELLATPDGMPLGTLCVIDTKPRPGGLTEWQRYVLRALARQVMTQLELGRALAQRASVLKLTDALRDLDDVADMALAGAKTMGHALGASHAGYGEVDAHRETISIRRYWSASGAGTFGGHYHLRDYGSYVDELKTGSMVVVTDAARDPRTAANAAALSALGVRAFLNVPVMERGVLVASFFVSCDTARSWLAEEIGLARDIADRTRGAIARTLAESELRHLNTTLAGEVAARTRERDRVWQVSRDMIGVADESGAWVSVNPAWTSVLGWSESEIVGRTSAWLDHPDDVMAARARRAEVIARRKTRMFESRMRTQAGDYRWLSWIAEYFEGFFYCVARDITADKAQAAALEAAAEQLRQSQKMEAVGQLTGGIAHDFNNLLTGIVGSLELMQTRILQGRTTDLARYVGAAQGAAQRAAALTHRLLAFSRRQTLDPKAVAVNRLITEMEEMVSRTVGPAIRLDVIQAPDLWITRCDPNQLENALLNLCINARDAMPDGGTLTVETANVTAGADAALARDLAPGDYVSVCVSDTGTGMGPDIVARAFDPFFTTKPLGLGTGLGLSMVYGFAKQSGGHVKISSAPGKGTRVGVFLPRHDAETEAAQSPRDLAIVPRATANQTILVVDDEPTVRMLVGEVLAEFGFGAIEAVDGVSGLRILESNVALDLLLTDVGLPGGMNGRQLADAARVLRPELKVLFMTGYAENAAFGDGLVAPGMAVITKPFAMEALGARIMGILKE